MMKRIYALIAAAAMAVSPVAATASASRSVAVEAGDLDLQSDKGQRILTQRIQRAARAVCQARAVASLPRNARGERRCIRDSQASAEAAVKMMVARGDPAAGKGG